MAIFDLEESKSVWFEIPGGGKIELQNLTADDWKEIRKQTVSKKIVFKKVEGTPSRLEYEEVNEELQNELFWDKIIRSWDGFSIKLKKDGKAQIIDCTPENCTKELKLLLISRSAKFAKFINESLNTLTDDEAEQQEQAEKN